MIFCLTKQDVQNVQLNNNKIASWSEVDKLAKLGSLQTVYLEHNPIYAEGGDAYRRKVIMALPQILQLDATVCRTGGISPKGAA
jgi:protein phosphatase 1 regulatory subunit 7